MCSMIPSGGASDSRIPYNTHTNTYDFRRITDQDDHGLCPPTPGLVSAGELSSNESNSSPVTPTPPPAPVLPPVAGPSTIPAEHHSEPEQPADMVEPDNEGTAGNPGPEVLSSSTYQCPFGSGGSRCTHMLVHNEKLIRDHVWVHWYAREVPENIRSCLLCEQFPDHASAPERRPQNRPDTGTTSSVQTNARHIFTTHFGGQPSVCRYCGKRLSRVDSKQRHEGTCKKKNQSSGFGAGA